MRYLENAFKFTFKNFIIVLPLLIGMAVPAIIMGFGSLGLLFNMGNMQHMIEQISAGGPMDFGPDFFMNLYGPTFIISSVIAGILSLGITLIVYPITYGLINKKYETGASSLSDIGWALSKYIGRYVLYLLLNIAIGIGLMIIFGVLIAIGVAVITLVSPVLGGILIALFVLAFIVGCIALYTYLSLWFPAICIEDTGVVEGLKNSFKYVSGNFWPILGITLLIMLCGGVASMIIGGILGLIPVIGSAAGSVVSTLAGYITIVFYFEVYREKSGRYASKEYYQQLDGNMQ